MAATKRSPLEDEYHALPGVGDGRRPIAEIHGRCDALLAAGWRRVEIAAQVTERGESLPIRAYLNPTSVDRVLIGGIHGREPAGATALAGYAERLRELGEDRSIRLLPLLNPLGYSRHVRYGPGGQSVSDSDHRLGRAPAPASPEAAAITAFVLDAVRINPGPAVLDVHEDPVYEAPDYDLEGLGSYLYLLLDLADPSRVVRRASAPLLHPTEPYETEGFFQNVVFSNGLIEKDGRVFIYYGAADETACVAVPDTTRALGDLGAYHRKRSRAAVIAITGSNGKTSTRRMAAEVVSRRFADLEPVKNLNNQIGVPLTLFELTPRHEWAVLELGTNRPGEIARVAEICAPNVGLITNIVTAHLEGLGSLEGVLAEKGAQAMGLLGGGQQPQPAPPPPPPNQFQPTPVANPYGMDDSPPPGIDPRQWAMMSPEQKRMFKGRMA